MKALSPEVIEEMNEISNNSLKHLAFVLTHKEYWPTGFIWNYDNIEECAIGLSHQIFLIKLDYSLDKFFNMDFNSYKDIFYQAHHVSWLFGLIKFKIPRNEVSPRRVASKINRYLKKEKMYV